MSNNDSPEEFISNVGHSPNIISTYEAQISHEFNEKFSEHSSNLNNDEGRTSYDSNKEFHSCTEFANETYDSKMELEHCSISTSSEGET